MNKKKTITLLIIASFIIILILIFILNKNDKSIQIPDPKELTSVTFIDFTDGKSSKKTSLSTEKDILKTIETLKKSEKTKKESVSDLPDEINFTLILFNFKRNGNSFISIYEDDNVFYIDQAYAGIYKIESKDIDLLKELRKSGKDKIIELLIDDVF